MQAPALLVAVPLLAGSAAAILLFDRLGHDVPLICAGAALLALVAGIGAAAQDGRQEASVAVCAGALLAGLSMGTQAVARAYHPALLRWFEAAAPQEPVIVEGVLREDASVTPFGVSMVVDVVSVGAPPRDTVTSGLRTPAVMGGVRLSIGGVLLRAKAGQWRAGRTVRAPASLRRPSTYLNPGTPDERRPLARRGIVLVGSVKSAALVEVVRRGSVLSEGAASIRAWTRALMARYIGTLDPKSGGLTTAVLIGDRSGLSSDDERRLQEAGTYHVIAISGGNIAVLAVLIVGAGRVLMVTTRATALVTCAALLFYGVVAAGAASVSRAVTVAVLVLGARAVDLRGSSLNALAIAAVLAVAIGPVVALDAGFILSFGATLGILLGVPLIVPRAGDERGGLLRRAARRVILGLAALSAATACAEVALLPVGAMLFSRVPLAGLVLNLVAIPMMTVVQIGGLLVAATGSWWDGPAELSGTIAHLAATGLLRSARLVDVAPWLSLEVKPPALWLVGVYYVTVLMILVRPVRPAAFFFWVGPAGVMLIGPQQATRDAVPTSRVTLRVVVLDVGQGDASLVALPGGRTLLVDAGGLGPLSSAPQAPDAVPGFDIGERVVTPALRALGVASLQGIVLTHGDPDHILGVRGLLRRVAATSLWEGVPVPPHVGLEGLMFAARERGISWRTVQAGDAERFGDVEVRVLHPPLPDWERQRVRNEDSVVLEVRVGRVSIILPGDIGAEGERAILPRLEPGRLVIVKAPHHGSGTSSTPALLNLLRPEAVIFSCGRDNRFGHPHPAVVARYHAIGSEVFSTATDGAVFVETDGTTVEVRGWTGRRVVFGARSR